MRVKDSGSNYSFYNGSPKASNLPRSVFDLSHINTMSAKLGLRYPVWTQHTLPNEDYRIDVEAVARVVNPPVVPLMSKQRILFHTYWLSYYQLWKQAQLFFDKGRNKKQYKESSTLKIPTMKLRTFERGSLADFLGFNCATTFKSEDKKTMTVSALKFMAYIRIWRDCYMNQRIYSAWLQKMASFKDPILPENQEMYKVLYDFLFPVDDADFRIGSEQWKALVSNHLAMVYLFNLKFANFADDYFTRSQLSPMYVDDDDIPSIDFQGGDVSFKLNSGTLSAKYPNGYNFALSGHSSGGGIETWSTSGFEHSIILNDKLNSKPDDIKYPQIGMFQDVPNRISDSSINVSGDFNSSFVSALNNTVKVENLVSSITIDAIRKCESATLILEKMAKTDGSYAQYAKAFFGERPKSAYDFRPTYVGGSYQSVVYSQVLNTTSDNQGKVTGIGISSGSGNIGRFHSDDYGLFMTIMTIVPDTYYCQGLNREDTYEVAEDFYLPERAQLGMQGVLEKEIYNQTDDKEEENNKLFGYQNVYDELRYRANEVHGDVADVDSASGSVGASFSPYIQTRYFKSAPTLTPSFLTMANNINNSWLSAKDEPPFIVQVANKVQAIRPVPYRAKPATFGM